VCPAASVAPENEALVRRYYDDAYNAQNLAVIDELLANDFVRHNAAAPQLDQQPGHADDVARVHSWLSAFPDLRISVEELLATSDTVVSYVIWSATQDGPLPQWGAPVTGRPMAWESRWSGASRVGRSPRTGS
jgi:predicted ester cyclase